MAEQTSSGGAGAQRSPAVRPTGSRPATWRTRGRLSYGLAAAIGETTDLTMTGAAA